MPASQDQIFADSEGDRWFARNKLQTDKFDPSGDNVCRLVELYGLNPHNVIEVGASNGVRLEAIRRRYHSNVTAVDVSRAALTDGAKRFPSIKFIQGAAHSIPSEDTFDLVIVNFVFHWIDRGKLLRSVGEIDRIVGEDGFLIVGDFYPANPTKVPYHHLPGQKVYTYKQNYTEIFVSSGLYTNVGMLTGDHSAGNIKGAVADNDRIGTWLLRKTDRYLPGTSKP